MQALQTQHIEAQSALLAPEPPAAAPGALPAAVPAAALPLGLAPGFAEAAGDSPATFVRQDRKVGRNEPCPCGSGKKFKHCHGVLSGGE